MNRKSGCRSKSTDITDKLTNRQDAVQRQEDAPVDQRIKNANIDVDRKVPEQHTHCHILNSVAGKKYPPDKYRGVLPRTTKHQRGETSTLGCANRPVYCQK